ncbi:MAG: HAMP domain-containing protein [Actinobacteria bacterium]|nr:MAG: HAMP domain-containing protein [Actinomycetota bacterium]
MARSRWSLRFARLPIRARLTIAFAGVMLAVLGAAGVFLYVQFRSDLDAQVDASLRVEVDNLKALVEAGPPGAVASSGAPFAHVYGENGQLVASTRRAEGSRLLSVREARRAVRQPERVARRTLPFGDVRIRAFPATAPGGRRIAVAVAGTLALRDHELARLRTLLLIAGPLALLLASIAGYELARAALLPVERMRAQAERITDRRLSERLPVPDPLDEIGALGRTLNVMLARVEAVLERERRLVSDASHELRTPLTTLRAEVDLALRGDRDPVELRAALESAAEEALRMTRLADDLLVLARADEGRLPLRPAPLVVRDMLEAAATRARAAAAMRERSIVIGGVALGMAVHADPDRTAQALDNLIANALSYGEGTVTLSSRAEDGLVELHVTDEGRGFPDHLLQRAFERFGRGAEARAGEPGSGLGLALVEAVATAQGGQVGARNLPEAGADVWMALPRVG